MLLPTSELAVLLILVVSLVAWGSWTSMFAIAKRWRFELFYYDFALGFVLFAIVAAFTLGSWDSKELTFQDNILLASRRQMVWVVGSGLLLGLGDLFLLAGATLSGTGVAFMLTFGVIAAINTIWEMIVTRDTNAVLAGGGAALAFAAVIAAVVSYRWRLADKENEEAQALRADPRLKKAAPVRSGTAAGVLLAILAGFVLTGFFRMLEVGIAGETGAAPYTAILLLCVGIAASGVFIVPFFLYFPVRGGALQVRHYLKGTITHHLLGLLGGILGATAVLTYIVARVAPPGLQASPVMTSYLRYGTPVVAAIWGVFVWQEFAGATFRVKSVFMISLVLLLASIGMVGVSAL